MSATIEAPAQVWTADDLARRFGPMPLSRIHFDPPPGEATEEDVDRLQVHHDLLCELIDGVLVRKPMGSFESIVAVQIITILNLFVQPNKLGWVLGEGGMLRLWPGRVRIPDVCYIARTQTADGKFPRDQRIADLYPDLAVEVLSDSNTAREMVEKRADYFRAGCRLVWIIDPKTVTAEIYTSPETCRAIGRDGVLTGEPVLPGLAVSLQQIFEIDATP